MCLWNSTYILSINFLNEFDFLFYFIRHVFSRTSTKSVYFLNVHRVNQHEAQNKMSLHNLATVFGPTLLRPGCLGSAKSESGSRQQRFDPLAAGTVDVMAQAGILYYFLQCHASPGLPQQLSWDSLTFTASLNPVWAELWRNLYFGKLLGSLTQCQLVHNGVRALIIYDKCQRWKEFNICILL